MSIDDERKARLEYVIDAAVPVAEFPSWRFRYSRRIADAVRAAGFRRSEPTDDEREALIKRLEDEVEYRVRTAVALAKGGHSHEGQVGQGRASVRLLAAGLPRSETVSDDAREAQRVAHLDARQAAYREDLALWFRDYDNAPEIASNAFFRGWDAAVDGGFRRSEVPEPSAEDEFAQDECDGSGSCPASRHIHGCYTRHRADQCDSPDEYGHLPAEPQGEQSDAVAVTYRNAAEVARAYSSRPGDIASHIEDILRERASAGTEPRPPMSLADDPLRRHFRNVRAVTEQGENRDVG